MKLYFVVAVTSLRTSEKKSTLKRMVSQEGLSERTPAAPPEFVRDGGSRAGGGDGTKPSSSSTFMASLGVVASMRSKPLALPFQKRPGG
jgi:hypothetical protein